MSLSDAKNVPEWQNNVFLFTIIVLNECTNSPQVFIHGRIDITIMKLRVTLIKEKLYYISGFDGVENMVNTDFLNTPSFSLTGKIVWRSVFCDKNFESRLFHI